MREQKRAQIFSLRSKLHKHTLITEGNSRKIENAFSRLRLDEIYTFKLGKR